MRRPATPSHDRLQLGPAHPGYRFLLGNISGIGSAPSPGHLRRGVRLLALALTHPQGSWLTPACPPPRRVLANPESEYNATLSLDAVTARAGGVLYVASDSRFRGLNVVLGHRRVGTANLQWQFWNGRSGPTSSPSRASGHHEHLKRNGIFWTGDPPELEPVLARAGPTLYVRAYVRPALHDEPRREPDHDRPTCLPVTAPTSRRTRTCVRAAWPRRKADVLLSGGETAR